MASGIRLCNSETRRHLPASFLLSTLLLSLLLTASACSANDTPDSAPVDGAIPTEAPEADEVSRDARKAADRFLDALSDEKFDKMWEMLTPEAQQRWPDQQTFKAFLGRKFSSRDISYGTADVELAPGFAAASIFGQLIVGESPYLSTLGLIRIEDSWLVADAGAAGPHGPILGPPGTQTAVHAELSVPIMIYHHFAPELPEDYGEALNTVTTTDFENQLAWLSENGYQSIALAELYNAFYYDLPLPPKPIIFVLDDGYEDAYLHAFPILQRYAFSATVAMITGAIDQPDYLSWPQIHEMASAGVQFVSHTANHVDLASTSVEATRSELALSRRVLEEGLRRPMQFLVYPYGQPFISGSPETQRMVMDALAEEGYIGALRTSSGPPYIALQKISEPYQLRRIPVSGGEILARFVASIGAAP